MATTKTTTADNLNTSAAAKAAASDYDSLKQDVAQLREDIQSFAGNSTKYVRGRSSAEIEKGLERGKEYASKASKQASSAKDYVEGKVRENPLTAVGIAFGTGVLLAALRRK